MQLEIEMIHKQNHNVGNSRCHDFSLELSTQTKTW